MAAIISSLNASVSSLRDIATESVLLKMSDIRLSNLDSVWVVELGMGAPLISKEGSAKIWDSLSSFALFNALSNLLLLVHELRFFVWKTATDSVEAYSDLTYY